MSFGLLGGWRWCPEVNALWILRDNCTKHLLILPVKVLVAENFVNSVQSRYEMNTRVILGKGMGHDALSSHLNWIYFYIFKKSSPFSFISSKAIWIYVPIALKMFPIFHPVHLVLRIYRGNRNQLSH